MSNKRDNRDPVKYGMRKISELTIQLFLQEALAQVSEFSEAGVFVRGTYTAPPGKVAEGERKLYLAIESTSELAVSKARKEIVRILKEEMLRIANSATYQGSRTGRYKV